MGRATVLVTDVSTRCVESNEHDFDFTHLNNQSTSMYSVHRFEKINSINQKRNLRD